MGSEIATRTGCEPNGRRGKRQDIRLLPHHSRMTFLASSTGSSELAGKGCANDGSFGSGQAMPSTRAKNPTRRAKRPRRGSANARKFPEPSDACGALKEELRSLLLL